MYNKRHEKLKKEREDKSLIFLLSQYSVIFTIKIPKNFAWTFFRESAVPKYFAWTKFRENGQNTRKSRKLIHAKFNPLKVLGDIYLLIRRNLKKSLFYPEI